MGGYALDDTIVAPGSARGAAAQAIVRISGPSARKAVLALISSPSSGGDLKWQPRELLPVSLAIAPFYSPLPVLLYYWPEGGSYTGQELVEIHTIGSPPIVDALVHALVGQGCRLARPGEFTLRAFLAGRLDLTQAEAVLGVVDAEDPGRLDAALRQLAGGVARPLRQVREDLLELVMLLEAGLDFPEEEDVIPLTPGEILVRLDTAHKKLWELMNQLEARGHSDSEWRVIITGAPNVGKSTLFNCLLGSEEALVFDRPGTTRDYLTVPWEVGGIPVVLVDTAGIGLKEEVGEKSGWCPRMNQLSRTNQDLLLEGQDRQMHPDIQAEQLAKEQIQEAEVEIFCIDASRPLSAWELTKLEKPSPRQIIAITKADLAWHPDVLRLVESNLSAVRLVVTSSREGKGVGELRRAIHEVLADSWGKAGEVVPSTAVRCGASMRRAVEAIDRARNLVETGASEELIAAEVRLALENIALITGEVYTEDILDRIFSRFCIGK